MNGVSTLLSAQTVADFEAWLEVWGIVVFLALFGLEMLRLLLKRKLSWNLAGDSVASFLSFGAFAVLTYGFIAAAYISLFYWAYLNFAVFDIPVTPWSVALLVVLCDFAYYWEHRFTHRVGMAWATHSVHHSSPFFNISVAYRFGPMDGVWPLFFHLPLAVAGFDPVLIFAGEAFVQLYQTGLHTEVIRKLPRPIEWLFNTPSHHRVHHGANDEYIDKNYSGIFILWDRLFGTFAEERAPVRFGITEPIATNNPIMVWLHGFTRLLRRARHTGSFGEAYFALVAPPEWQPGQRRAGPQKAILPAALMLLLAGGALSYAAGSNSDPAAANASTPGLDAPTAGATAAPQAAESGEAALRALADRYYQATLNGDVSAVEESFSPDAYVHYRMDFGSYFGSTEFGYRVADMGAVGATGSGGELDASMNGFSESYEGFDGRYKILAASVQQAGDALAGEVLVEYVEQYRWDGYNGVMQSRETLQVVNMGGYLVIQRLDAEQTYR
ncbi:MAG: sterol desaturase family protein [Pseudomonadota bacterium]